MSYPALIQIFHNYFYGCNWWFLSLSINVQSISWLNCFPRDEGDDFKSPALSVQQLKTKKVFNILRHKKTKSRKSWHLKSWTHTMFMDFYLKNQNTCRLIFCHQLISKLITIKFEESLSKIFVMPKMCLPSNSFEHTANEVTTYYATTFLHLTVNRITAQANMRFFHLVFSFSHSTAPATLFHQ